ncbi:hypothetical protein KUH03_31100 [Sphingobacterium sp. E70]|uniref:glycosyltransferase family 32 protein n=1 Tax=Sphingobacterium sp. E70 TaxID=2853439 RepID=UPI00211CCC17|nr:glycosyltransferase [Sphingobacterium sp. E70]ULT23584.1 hypothetical protein KUH03_31100 [Sphingobacterium sp. E70]
MLPKIIHQIAGKSPSKLVSVCLGSWQSLLDFNYEIIYWDDESLADFIGKHYPFALEAFLTARNTAEAADIARYLLVYHYGGYYIDWDISLNNISLFKDLYISKPNGYFVIDPLNDTLASEHFCSPPGNNYLHQLVTDIVATYDRGERDLMNTPQYSGPYRMRSTMRKFSTGNFTFIPVKEIFEYSYDEIRGQSIFRKKAL